MPTSRSRSCCLSTYQISWYPADSESFVRVVQVAEIATAAAEWDDCSSAVVRAGSRPSSSRVEYCLHLENWVILFKLVLN